jgi:hypothetical protein
LRRLAKASSATSIYARNPAETLQIGPRLDPGCPAAVAARSDQRCWDSCWDAILHQDHPKPLNWLRCNGSGERARRDSNPQPSDPYYACSILGPLPASMVTRLPTPDHSSLLAISISRHEPRHGDHTVSVRPGSAMPPVRCVQI